MKSGNGPTYGDPDLSKGSWRERVLAPGVFHRPAQPPSSEGSIVEAPVLGPHKISPREQEQEKAQDRPTHNNKIPCLRLLYLSRRRVLSSCCCESHLKKTATMHTHTPRLIFYRFVTTTALPPHTASLVCHSSCRPTSASNNLRLHTEQVSQIKTKNFRIPSNQLHP